GARVDAAPTFEGVLNRTSPRTDVPKFELSAAQLAHDAQAASSDRSPPTPMQIKLLPFLLQQVTGNRLGESERLDIIADLLVAASSAQDLS
ncbi:hypothetical protein ACJEM9_24335, partial [Escherichia coli]